MGWSNNTLFILKEKQKPKAFIPALIKQLKTIGWSVVLAEESVCFNDSVNGEEKECVYFGEETSEQSIIDLLVSWKGLGMLTFFTQDFEFPIVINFLSWDDISVEGFSIGCNGKDKLFMHTPEKHRTIIYEISEFANFKLVVGDVEDYNYHDKLSEFIQQVNDNHFEILIKN